MFNTLGAYLVYWQRPLKWLSSFLLGASASFMFREYPHPLPIAVLSFMALPSLFLLWLNCHSRAQAAGVGFAFGLGLFSVGMYWLAIPLHDIGGLNAGLTLLCLSLLFSLLALFPALIGLLQHRPTAAPTWRLLGWMPVTWVLIEWLRANIFTGLPWLHLGYADLAIFSPLVPLLGMYAKTWAIAASAGSIAYLAYVFYKQPKLPTRLGLASIMLASLALLSFAQPSIPRFTQNIGLPLAVSLLQGNINQDEKWQNSGLEQSVMVYANLARQAKGELLITPETALPVFWQHLPLEYTQGFSAELRAQNKTILLGVPDLPETASANNRNPAYYNAIHSLGMVEDQSYYKVHLVPFGETIPLKPLSTWLLDGLNMPLADFTAGQITQKPIQIYHHRIAASICYEDIFPDEFNAHYANASLLINITNDGWFGDSSAPHQHLLMAQMRALETGRYLLRATNTGQTAVINPEGKVIARAKPFKVAILEASVYSQTGMTPYLRYGSLPILSLASLLFSALYWRERRKKRTI